MPLKDYTKDILSIIDSEELKSTNEIVALLEKKLKKTLNWERIYRRLLKLEKEGRLKKVEVKQGFYWKKK